MKCFQITALLLLNIMLNLSVAHAAENLEQIEFSAEMVMKAHNQVMQGKIYVSNQKTRMENPMSTIIARPDLNVSWVLMPQQKMYMEQALDLSNLPKTAVHMPGEIERTEIGAETVDGKPAKKFKVTYAEGGRQDSMYQWMADGIPIPVKMESLDGSWSVEYRNVYVGPQPAVIFEVPPSYQKMAMPNMNDMMAQALRDSQ